MIFDFVNGKHVAKEIAENVDRHVSEMEDRNDYGQPEIDWDYYLGMCHAGHCHVLTMRDSVTTGSDHMGQYYGTMAVDSTIQRLDAHPVGNTKSIFMGA